MIKIFFQGPKYITAFAKKKNMLGSNRSTVHIITSRITTKRMIKECAHSKQQGITECWLMNEWKNKWIVISRQREKEKKRKIDQGENEKTILIW